MSSLPGEPKIGSVEVGESRSSVAIEQNSKGEPAAKIKIYADSTDLAAADLAADKAIEIYRKVVAAVGA